MPVEVLIGSLGVQRLGGGEKGFAASPFPNSEGARASHAIRWESQGCPLTERQIECGGQSVTKRLRGWQMVLVPERR